MPILFQINATANWGSTGRIAEQIGQKAIERGWDSYIAYSRYANKSTSKLIRVGNNLTTYFHALLARLFDIAGLGSYLSTKTLLRKIRRIKPDIIHIHNIHGYVLNYKHLFKFLKGSDINVVWTFHDCWAFTGHCAHFVTANCTKWKKMCHSCALKKTYPASFFLDRSEQNFRLKKQYFVSCNKLTIIPASFWLADFVRESFLNEKRIEVIHNGVDLSVFRPTNKESRKHGLFTVLAVSNVWNREKGLYDILQLRQALSSEYKIIVVGVTSEQQKLFPDGIISLQRTQNVKDLVDLYSSADVFINPTYADTFPTVNLESLACGTPVITYRTGGSPEAIDENTGIVVEQGDINGMVKAIKRIRQYPLSSLACRERAEMYFDNNKCFSKYIDLYEDILNR